MNFSAAEQAILDEMVRTRNVELERPPWMQSHRWTAMKKEARRRIAKLPPLPKSSTGRSAERSVKQTYWAPQRVTGVPVGKFAIHESDGDLPICMYGTWFANGNVPREQLGPGQVDCGHCANSNA